MTAVGCWSLVHGEAGSAGEGCVTAVGCWSLARGEAGSAGEGGVQRGP